MRPGTYPLINAATLSLLSGDVEESRALAGQVLTQIGAAPDEPETPYWRSATSAEALLLLGREAEADTALIEAIALAPLAWEDHASTLRQFALILDAQGKRAAWLDAHRPPRSLHFGGHMSFDADVVGREHLDEKIAAALNEEKVGFGYGALAAGADIIVAEALVARGAELHVVLPGGPQAFAAVSVDPFGKNWRRRFDVLIERAQTVRTVRPAGTAPSSQTIGLADEIAMGAAAINARRLESEAVQLLVLDSESGSGGLATARAQAVWTESRRRRRLVTAPREAIDASHTQAAGEQPRERPLAVIAVVIAESAEGLALEQRLGLLRQTLAEAPQPSIAPYWTGERVLLAHERLEDAADLGLLLAGGGYRVGGDYVAGAPVADPFSGRARLGPSVSGAAEAAAASTPNGSACVTEDFAAALAARGRGSIRSEMVGELDSPDAGPPIGLYALK